jgi:uracil-DNA glycosylase
MIIKVLGPGCNNCKNLERATREAVAAMGIDATIFYDKSRVAIVPMGYCYPGRGASGDLPPRRECAPLWLDQLLAYLPQIELTLLVGRYAQDHFLRGTGHVSVTATTQGWRARRASSRCRILRRATSHGSRPTPVR